MADIHFDAASQMYHIDPKTVEMMTAQIQVFWSRWEESFAAVQRAVLSINAMLNAFSADEQRVKNDVSRWENEGGSYVRVSE